MPDSVIILLVLLAAAVVFTGGMAAAEHFYGVTVPQLARRLWGDRDGGDR